ncbi:MAG: DNA and RNA helicase [Firmicutes bacterium]|nr:DNA and RNA helicase [Bacillota bacterium]
MFECKIPLFNPAPLRKEILESMRDLAVSEQAARYSGYSDGILAGCELFEQNMNIGVSSGLVRFAGRVYVLDKPDSVPYRATDAWTVLKIQFGGEKISRDFSIYEGRLVLDENTNVLPNEIELGRFKLKRGSRLRTKYVDFQDMETEFDTVNPFNVPFAGIGEHTLMPVIVSYFAREAYPYAHEAPDIAFCTSCLANSGAMSRESIRLYLWRRYSLDGEMFDNHALHARLADALAEIKGEARQGGQGLSDGIWMP